MNRRACSSALTVRAITIAVLTAGVLAGSGARADTASFCQLLSEKRSPERDTGLALPALGEAECKWSLGLGGASTFTCHWPFAYRANEATQAFEQLTRDVAVCAGDFVEPQGDVNHPDSYDLRLFSFNGAVIAVSLKDKGALKKSYVFLRLDNPE